jgi:hypothetical protein
MLQFCATVRSPLVEFGKEFRVVRLGQTDLLRAARVGGADAA